jgi:hypothetical protein
MMGLEVFGSIDLLLLPPKTATGRKSKIKWLGHAIGNVKVKIVELLRWDLSFGLRDFSGW